mmetsp:Transcript_25139/g.38913  ORF Transcript_25139/g.38913 Transcript_25139/m.38913 type:complete len:245 (-) Transcript_25139:108-842(-)
MGSTEISLTLQVLYGNEVPRQKALSRSPPSRPRAMSVTRATASASGLASISDNDTRTRYEWPLASVTSTFFPTACERPTRDASEGSLHPGTPMRTTLATASSARYSPVRPLCTIRVSAPTGAAPVHSASTGVPTILQPAPSRTRARDMNSMLSSPVEAFTSLRRRVHNRAQSGPAVRNTSTAGPEVAPSPPASSSPPGIFVRERGAGDFNGTSPRLREGVEAAAPANGSATGSRERGGAPTGRR